MEKSGETDSKHEKPSYSKDLGAATQADIDYLCPRQPLRELNFLDISHFYFCLEQTLSQFVQYSHSKYLTPRRRLDSNQYFDATYYCTFVLRQDNDPFIDFELK